MKIAVAGTGYVGLSIATLLSQHHEVMAVDIIPEKVDLINHRKSPIQDEYIEKYLAEKDLNLVATLDAEAAYTGADFVVIAAPTNYDSKKNFFDTSAVEAVIRFPESMFYEILSARAGMPIESDGQLLELLTELSRIKREYDRLADALASVRATGYGVVGPGPEELKLEKPEVLKKNGSYGVKLRAMAPSIHMIRVDVDTEISPMVGGEEQSKELIEYLGGQEPEKLWQSNIFGKSVYDLIQEGLNAKLLRLPEDVRTKFRGTLGRIVNEGATGLVCLIL